MHDDAGAAHAAPASSSVRAGRDVVPTAARLELDRVRRRWGELSTPRAAPAVPGLRAVVDTIAALTDDAATVPDLGPAALPDQLAVVVWDAYSAGQADGVAAALTELRRALP